MSFENFRKINESGREKNSFAIVVGLKGLNVNGLGGGSIPVGVAGRGYSDIFDYFSGMKIYFDSCGLQRPFDDQQQILIATETEAVLGVLSLWESGNVDLIGLEALDYEAEQIPTLECQAYMKELLAKIKETVIITDSISQQAAFLVSNAIKPLDALHLACAEEANVDYFYTSDDKFLKKAKKLANQALKVVSPLELVTKLP